MLPDQEPGLLPVETNDDELRESARNSLDLLAFFLAPLVYIFPFPRFYIALWTTLTEAVNRKREFPQFALGLPRGFAKTFFIKLFVCYCVIFTHKRFILIVAENIDKGTAMVRDCCRMLSSPSIVRLFGRWDAEIEQDKGNAKIFKFRGRTIILKGVGINSGIRGISEDNARPDVMLFDDIQSRADAKSESTSKELEQEFYGTAMKAKNPIECMFVFIANMYPTEYSILRKLKKNPGWKKIITGGILADGSSLWEELQPITQLVQEFLNDFYSGNEQIFFAEVMNDENAKIFNQFDLNKLPPYPYEDNDVTEQGWIIVDPSNDKDNSDAVAIGAFKVIDGKSVGHDIKDERLSPKEIVVQALKMAIKYGYTVVFYESNAFQYSLLFWHNEVCKELGLTGIEALDVYSGKSSKNSRIMRMLRSYMQGEIYCHPSCQSLMHSEIGKFDPSSTKNKDNVLDLFTYEAQIRKDFNMQISRINIQLLSEEDSSEVVLYNSPF